MDEDAYKTIMMQMNTLSNLLADSKMENEELQKTNKELIEKQNIMQKEIQSMKEKVVFQNVEMQQLELNKLKADKKTNETAIATLKKELEITSSALTKAKEEYTEHNKLYNADTMNTMENTLTECKKQIVELQEAIAIKDKELATLHEEVSSFEEKMEKRINDVTAVHVKDIQAMQAEEHKIQKSIQDKADEFQSERNNYKKKAESMRKDLAKLIKTDEERTLRFQVVEDTNRRLGEELDRKTRSLKDAMEAMMLSEGIMVPDIDSTSHHRQTERRLSVTKESKDAPKTT